jgi:tRNA(Arg) A34 adenosine deaminase TadA
MTSKQNITAIIQDRKGRVLSIGKNSYDKTHPKQKQHALLLGLPDKVFLHAEIAAIVKCKSLEKAYKITITRINKKGEPALAKPCPICQSAIEASGIKLIEHS